MNKYKLMTIIGTRPEIIRTSRIMSLCDQFFNHKIVYTNQNFDYELSSIFFKEMKLREPDYILDVKADTIGGQIGNILVQTESIMLKENPDGIFILGDTNSALSSIIAKRLKIPIFHMEAGNRCFDWDVPEEINRRIVDHISDYNLCYTEHARRYLINEGLPIKNIFVVGSPMKEILTYYKKNIASSDVLNTLKVKHQDYFLVSVHREAIVEDKNSLLALFDAIGKIAQKNQKKVVVSLHPRTASKLKNELRLPKNIVFFKPFGFFAYNYLQLNSFCVISDSGTIQEESAIYNFPAVQVRNSTERPEAYDSGSIIVCGYKIDAIENSIKLATSSIGKFKIPFNYDEDNVSYKVVKIIMSMLSINHN
jgi:UDP-N-acetyl-L-fucosamine synthase